MRRAPACPEWSVASEARREHSERLDANGAKRREQAEGGTRRAGRAVTTHRLADNEHGGSNHHLGGLKGRGALALTVA